MRRVPFFAFSSVFRVMIFPANSRLLPGGLAANGSRDSGRSPSCIRQKHRADGPWPFTVEDGELVCIGPVDDPGVFLVTARGEMFALNPAAILMAERVGARADLDPIWRNDPDILGAKVNVSPMILYALTLC